MNLEGNDKWSDEHSIIEDIRSQFVQMLDDCQKAIFTNEEVKQKLSTITNQCCFCHDAGGDCHRKRLILMDDTNCDKFSDIKPFSITIKETL